MDFLKHGQNSNGCFFYVILNQFCGLFTTLTLSLYVVNNIVYMFGAKWVSLKRITIELVIEVTYCFFLNSEFMHKYLHRGLIIYGIDLNRLIQYLGVLLISIFTLEKMYYILGSHCFPENMKHPIVSQQIFQILGFIIIILSIFDAFINSFNYSSCIQAMQYSLSASYLLVEPLDLAEESGAKLESVVSLYTI